MTHNEWLLDTDMNGKEGRWYTKERPPTLAGEFWTRSTKGAERLVRYEDGEWFVPPGYEVAAWWQDKPEPIDAFIDDVLAGRGRDHWDDALQQLTPAQLRAMVRDGGNAREESVVAAVGVQEAAGVRALEVDVIRVFRVTESADVVLSGRVIAMGERYLAQDVGGDVVMHDSARLSHRPDLGDAITIDYQDGHGQVYSGVLDRYQVVVRCPDLDPATRIDISQAVRAQLVANPGALANDVSLSELVMRVSKQVLDRNKRSEPGAMIVSTYDEAIRDVKDSAAMRPVFRPWETAVNENSESAMVRPTNM